jgi:hypothetical protein
MRLPIFTAILMAGLSLAPAFGGDMFDSGKLLATGGVSQVEGAGGGGLAVWALTTGYGTNDGIGANVHYTAVPLPDFNKNLSITADYADLGNIAIKNDQHGAYLSLQAGL